MTTRTPSRRIAVALTAFLCLVGALLVAPTTANAADPITVSVRILRVAEVSCDEGDLVPCPDDPYARVSINGQGFDESDYIDNPDPPDVRPYWNFSRTVAAGTTTVPVVIEIWDDDDSSADDQLDACDPGNDDISITLDVATGGWTGDTAPNTGFCKGANVAVTFDVSLDGTGDFDGDGIPDGVERFGIRDANGAVILDLAALGADPCRPSIVTEIDFMDGAADGHTHRPLQAALDEAAAMFDQAPVTAPSGCPYPGTHKSTGIDLISVVDDPIPEQMLLDWSNGAEAVRDANFDPNLRPYLHYSLWTHQRPAPDTGSSGVCCSNSGKDPLISLGGWTNDVGSVREQAGTYVHELGHALRLDHGGNVGDAANNCKPNYLSVMSYLFQTSGIPDPTLPALNVDTDNNGILDSRLRLDYSAQALPPLVESSLDENLGIQDGTDSTLWTNDGGANTSSAAGNGPINWNGNTDAGGNPVIENPVSVDLNDFGFSGCDAVQKSTLTGFDDWANIKFQAALSTDKGGAVQPDQELTYATSQQISAMVAEAARPDLAITLSGSPDPVLTGGTVTYTATVHNLSPMPADNVTVSFTAPAGTTASSTSAVFPLVAGNATVTAPFTVTVPCALADGTVLTATASVASDPTDKEPGNDSATASVVASNPPPVINGLKAVIPVLWPPDHKLFPDGVSYTVQDNCGQPAVALSVASSQPVTSFGDHTSPDWMVISPTKVLLRSERAGFDPAGRVYTLTVTATDSVGGTGSASTTVTVPLKINP